MALALWGEAELHLAATAAQLPSAQAASSARDRPAAIGCDCASATSNKNGEEGVPHGHRLPFIATCHAPLVRHAPPPTGARTMTRAFPSPTSAAPARPRLVVADRNAVVRAGLLDFLGKQGCFDVAAAVDTGNALIDTCEHQRPLIAVVGWTLLDMSALDVLATLRRRQLPTRIVIYAAEEGTEQLRQAARGGAWGYVSRNEDPELLLDTLAAVARGRLSLPYVDIERLVSDPIDQLTKREKELLGALAQGWTNLQIGARFGISGNTVKYHLKNLYEKLGVKNRAMAVALFVSSPAGAAGNAAPMEDNDDDWR